MILPGIYGFREGQRYQAYNDEASSHHLLSMGYYWFMLLFKDLPVVGADFLAALVASCFLGALPPVDLRAVCLVLAILKKLKLKKKKKKTKKLLIIS